MGVQTTFWGRIDSTHSRLQNKKKEHRIFETFWNLWKFKVYIQLFSGSNLRTLFTSVTFEWFSFRSDNIPPPTLTKSPRVIWMWRTTSVIRNNNIFPRINEIPDQEDSGSFLDISYWYNILIIRFLSWSKYSKIPRDQNFFANTLQIFGKHTPECKKSQSDRFDHWGEVLRPETVMIKNEAERGKEN